jgi:DNA-binding GntR family transcriptional regulator
VSHTPIREALITLAGIGLVELEPNRGAMVRPVTRSDIRDLCQVRRTLECEAVRGACGRIERDRLELLRHELLALVDAPATDWSALLDEARRVDSSLHDLIARSCGNAFLANELGRLKILFRAFRDIAWDHERFRDDFTRLTGEAREHLAIVDGLLSCDRRRVTLAMAKHIRVGQRYWSRALPGASASIDTASRRTGPAGTVDSLSEEAP